MKKKTRKSTAFWATFWALLGLYGFTTWIVPATLPTIGPMIIGALAFAGFGYQATNVADNWQRSAHYIPALDESRQEEK